MTARGRFGFESGFSPSRPRAERHVVPDDEHVIDPTCWCQPVLDYEDPVTGGRVYVHRRTIDGPAYEVTQ